MYIMKHRMKVFISTVCMTLSVLAFTEEDEEHVIQIPKLDINHSYRDDYIRITPGDDEKDGWIEDKQIDNLNEEQIYIIYMITEKEQSKNFITQENNNGGTTAMYLKGDEKCLQRHVALFELGFTKIVKSIDSNVQAKSVQLEKSDHDNTTQYGEGYLVSEKLNYSMFYFIYISARDQDEYIIYLVVGHSKNNYERYKKEFLKNIDN